MCRDPRVTLAGQAALGVPCSSLGIFPQIPSRELESDTGVEKGGRKKNNKTTGRMGVKAKQKGTFPFSLSPSSSLFFFFPSCH